MREHRTAARHAVRRARPAILGERAATNFPQPVAILPVQFHDLCRRSVCRSGAQQLALAVLRQAIEDLHKYRWARRRRLQSLYRDAYEWVASTDRQWPYSFVNICESLQLSHTPLRAELLSTSSGDVNVAA